VIFFIHLFPPAPIFISFQLLLSSIFASAPGLPDVIFSDQKSHFWFILEGLVMENVGLFHGLLGYFTAISYILWSFGNFVVSWYISPHFGILHQ
jgi:hypothetical protein